tara:strand:- start:165 stop:407 length:243 start_codon:yes stop_codon:yes gene_type:complete
MDLTAVFIILGCIVFIITIYFNCSACMRDYRQVQQLTTRVWTEADIMRVMNDMHIRERIPVAEGVKVNNITEDLEIIDPD